MEFPLLLLGEFQRALSNRVSVHGLISEEE
jgi:hypothetical protein